MKELKEQIANDIQERTGFSREVCERAANESILKIKKIDQMNLEEMSPAKRTALNLLKETGSTLVRVIDAERREIEQTLLELGCWEDQLLSDAAVTVWNI